MSSSEFADWVIWAVDSFVLFFIIYWLLDLRKRVYKLEQENQKLKRKIKDE